MAFATFSDRLERFVEMNLRPSTELPSFEMLTLVWLPFEETDSLYFCKIIQLSKSFSTNEMVFILL